MKSSLLTLAGMLLLGAAQAQPFPSKVVKIVVAYAPGGATDVVTL